MRFPHPAISLVANATDPTTGNPVETVVYGAARKGAQAALLSRTASTVQGHRAAAEAHRKAATAFRAEGNTAAAASHAERANDHVRLARQLRITSSRN